MANTTSFYSKQLSVFNPHSYTVSVPSVSKDANGNSNQIHVSIPGNCWRFVPNSEEALRAIAELALRRLGDTGTGESIPGGFVPSPTTPSPGVNNPNQGIVKDAYEDLVTITHQILLNGFFYSTKQVIEVNFDSAEFVPQGGVDQIYGRDYTCVQDGTRTKVIFSSVVPGGPSKGIQTILEAGDHVSFRYLSV